MNFSVLCLLAFCATSVYGLDNGQSSVSTLREQADSLWNSARITVHNLNVPPVDKQLANSILEHIIQTAQNIIQHIQAILTDNQNTATTLQNQLQMLTNELHGAANQDATSRSVMALRSFVEVYSVTESLKAKNSPLTQAIVDLINQFNLEHQITGTLSNTVIQMVAGIIHSLGFSPMAQGAVSALLGEDLAHFVFEQFQLGARSSGDAQHRLSPIADMLQQMSQALTPVLQQMQELVLQVVKDVLQEIYANAAPVVSDFLNAFQSTLSVPSNQLYQKTVQRLAKVF
ncbi:uncharacterized protein LOC129584126 [Paramacrobiotus metropolitanus]|uniref:uncharacterized protein LOC129584126 n=1 Tax=Paramacrobiotus metropolitanus TaxID=2943436 RepID=UPI002445A6B7|nr:uncharacterized protein LOC129584126 [Paramacrobiotus metropolitanus]